MQTEHKDKRVAASPGSDWRWQLQHSCRTLRSVLEALNMPEWRTARLQPVADRYPVRVTPYYLSLAESGNAEDPIVRQCLPAEGELGGAGGSPDPLGEDRYSPVPGLVHRYPDRVLFKLTGSCAVHCRHCFRKRQWAAPEILRDEQLQAALNYIRGTPSIHEVILSGGDPLLLSDERLETLLANLRGVRHVDIIRIGTRLPAVLPQRFTPEFCQLLGRYGPLWVAAHINHARECTVDAEQACARLLGAGVPVVSQTVLLKGVNDSAASMRALCRALLRIRVKPYYVFHGDPAAGAMHFRTGIDRALSIMADLHGHLSGLAVPQLALDLPDGGGKIPLLPDYRSESGGGDAWRFINHEGRELSYADSQS